MYRSTFAALATAALLVTGSAAADPEGADPPNDGAEDCWISPSVPDPSPGYWKARNDVSKALTRAR